MTSDTGGGGVSSVVKAPITLWVALAGQFVALAFWMGTLNSSVGDNTKEIDAIKRVDINARLGRLEVAAVGMDKQLDRIERKLDRITPSR